MDLEDAYLIGPDGDNNRQREAEQERTAAARRELDRTMLPLLCWMVFFAIGHIIWYFAIISAIILKCFLGHQLYVNSLSFINIAIFLPPIIKIIIMSIYTAIEKQAFEEFENMFPAFEDGLGDSKRLQFFTWKELSKILWMKLIKENIKSIILFICALILVWNIGFKINELHLLYCNLTPPYKFLIVGPLSVIAFQCEYIPSYLALFLICDSYCEFIPPSIHTTVEPITMLSLILWIPRIVGLYYIFKKSRELQEERIDIDTYPSTESVARVITGRITGDPNEQMVSTLILFLRWMEITQQVQRITAMGIHQHPLIQLND